MGGASIVAVMSDPDLYGPDVTSVELRETHISWVFLAGDRAYKVKKPVLMPFLDYRKGAARRHFCFEELRLNRRLAPEVYLGVCGLERVGDTYTLTRPPSDNALEYVVEMRRIPDDQTLASRLAAGRIANDEIDTVAVRLAEFHASARVAPAARPLIAQIAPTIDSLVAHSDGETRGRLRLLAQAVRATYVRVEEELDARARDGLVRECHGDLRAEHVAFVDPLAIIDCVEFDPALRQIDIGADIAFLVMDLERLGAGWAADQLLDRYRECGGDPGSDDVQALFCAYRACVRANIAAIRSRQDELLALERLAWRHLWRANAPAVIVVCGPPAVGKTTLAREICTIAGAEHLNSDRIRKELTGVSATARAPDAAYTPGMTRTVYSELARRCLDAERVVVDATFRRRKDREEFAAYLAPVEPLFVECTASPRTLATRARTRDRRGVSDAGPVVAARLAAEFEPLTEVPQGQRLTLDTSEPVELVAARLSAWLAARAARADATHSQPA
jgi:aminoglycoside phosphotransferase family enzyme/predicted kinase